MPEDKPKMVKVKPHKDHKCEINKVQYDLKKGKAITVPEFVAQVLKRADVIA